jgi:HEAT repeat protein
MVTSESTRSAPGWEDLIAHPEPSVRLRAAMVAGTQPDVGDVEALVRRCRVEPEFAVRDMLTWALVRRPAERTVDLLLDELGSPDPQARSQALHTLSKIGGPRVWPAITHDLLQDLDDEVARTAWRTAVDVVPEDAAADLAGLLATQLGRGDRDVRLSLSRALVRLGAAAEAALERARSDDDDDVRAHASATRELALDPERGVDLAVARAARAVALRGAPLVDG